MQNESKPKRQCSGENDEETQRIDYDQFESTVCAKAT